MPLVGAESTWEKFSAFLNSFHPEFKQLKQGLEQIKDKICRLEMPILFNQTKVKMMMPIYIYIYRERERGGKKERKS